MALGRAKSESEALSENELFKFDYVANKDLQTLIDEGDLDEESLECPVCLIPIELDTEVQIVQSDIVDIEEFILKFLT